MRLTPQQLPALITMLALLAVPSAHAADATYTDEASFLAGAGNTTIESFEGLAARLRTLAPISTPLLTLSPTVAPIGLQTGTDSPETGFGATAVDGSRYVSVYLPNLPQGTLRFDLATPSTTFGFYLTDVGETPGQILLRTSAGAFASDTVVASFPPLLGNGSVRFVGLTQTQAFSQVFLTVQGVDEAYGLDKVYISAVPEPAPAALLGLGLAALWVRRRR